MALGSSRHLEEDSKTSVAELPPEILQHICSLLQDPDDVASCHLVDSRCVRPCRACISLHLVKCMLLGWRLYVATVNNACCVDRLLPLHKQNVRCISSAAGSVPQQGLHCIAHFRSTLASSRWHCGTATRCATWTQPSCPTATWARTLQRCRAAGDTASGRCQTYNPNLLQLHKMQQLLVATRQWRQVQSKALCLGIKCDEACNAAHIEPEVQTPML